MVVSIKEKTQFTVAALKKQSEIGCCLWTTWKWL